LVNRDSKVSVNVVDCFLAFPSGSASFCGSVEAREPSVGQTVLAKPKAFEVDRYAVFSNIKVNSVVVLPFYFLRQLDFDAPFREVVDKLLKEKLVLAVTSWAAAPRGRFSWDLQGRHLVRQVV